MDKKVKNVLNHPVVKWMVVGVLAFALVFGGIAAFPEAALAGSNGQMLRVGNACSNPATLNWVKITGYNQNNRFATWESRPNSSSVQTNGYWWVGAVRIEWRTNRDNGLHSTMANVPKSFERDWYAVLLDKWGC